MGVLAVAACVHGDTKEALTALGLTLPGLLLQDSWRYAFFVARRGGQAFLSDAVWATSQIPALLLLRMSGNRSVFWFVLAWGGAATVAAAVGMWQARVVPRLTGIEHWLSDHRDLGGRYAASEIISSGASQVRNTILGSMLGLAAIGYVQAAGTLMGPFMVIFYGIGLVTIPEAVRVLRRSPPRLPLFCVGVGCGLAVAALIWGMLLLLALPRGLGELMLGSIWRPTYVLVLPQTIAVTGMAFSAGASTGLGALGAAKRTVRAATIGSVGFLVCGVIGPLTGGALGTMIGAAISAWLGAIVFWWELRKAMRDNAIPRPGAERRSDIASGEYQQPFTVPR
jgi:O-antigen/teichoic acid export membrane protein